MVGKSNIHISRHSQRLPIVCELSPCIESVWRARFQHTGTLRDSYWAAKYILEHASQDSEHQRQNRTHRLCRQRCMHENPPGAERALVGRVHRKPRHIGAPGGLGPGCHQNFFLAFSHSAQVSLHPKGKIESFESGSLSRRVCNIATDNITFGENTLAKNTL